MLILRYVKKLSYQDIANNMHCSKQAVQQRLSTLPGIEAVEEYSQNPVGALRAGELAILSDIIDPAKREKASLNNCAYTFKELFTARRLEDGKSTQNIAYADVLKAKDQAKMDLEEVRKVHKMRHNVESNGSEVIDITGESGNG